jgi:site-specific DNA-cytosine methylase
MAAPPGPIVFEDPEWARCFRQGLASAVRPVRVMHPCAGVNAPERAAREMGMPWVSTGDWEVNSALWGALHRVSSNPATLRVGPRTGNVLEVQLKDLDLRTDGIVSGPPCPPFSTIGKRLGECDVRSCVFLTVCAWIIHLAVHGDLTWFVLENVEGITSKRKHDSASFADWFLAEMMRDLPSGWSIRVVPHNSRMCLLPQSRPRVFFVGISESLQSTRRLRRISSQPPFAWPPVKLIDFLDLQPCATDWERLSTRQQVNVLEQLQKFRLTSSEDEGQDVAVADISRDPLRPYDSSVAVDSTHTLRTNSAHLWLLPSARLSEKLGPKGRLLNRSEKCRAAGIVPETLSSLTDYELDFAIGNTIPVPLIGTILYPVLRAWAEAQGPLSHAPQP